MPRVENCLKAVWLGERVAAGGGESPYGMASYWREKIERHPFFDPDKEHLAVLLLDTKLRCTGWSLVGVGTLNECLVHAREILRPVIAAGAYGFVLMHNHPSGVTTPSRGDIRSTEMVRDAARLIGVEFLDHVIVGRSPGDAHFSFHTCPDYRHAITGTRQSTKTSAKPRAKAARSAAATAAAPRSAAGRAETEALRAGFLRTELPRLERSAKLNGSASAKRIVASLRRRLSSHSAAEPRERKASAKHRAKSSRPRIRYLRCMMPDAMVAAIDQAAAQLGIDRAAFIDMAVRDRLDRLTKARTPA